MEVQNNRLHVSCTGTVLQYNTQLTSCYCTMNGENRLVDPVENGTWCLYDSQRLSECCEESKVSTRLLLRQHPPPTWREVVER